MNSLYLYISLRHPGRVKIGHSGNCENRRKTLSRDLRSVVIGGGMWIIFASRIEKALHGIYAPLNTNHGVLSKIKIRLFRWTWQPFPPMPFHSGYNEYFWIANLFTYLLCCIFFVALGTTGPIIYWSLLIIIFPLPLDLMLLILTYWVFNYLILCYIVPPLGVLLNLGKIYLKLWFFDFIK